MPDAMRLLFKIHVVRAPRPVREHHVDVARVALAHRREILPDERNELAMRVVPLLRQVKKELEPPRVAHRRIGRAQTGQNREIVRFVFARVGRVVTPLVREIERPLEPEQIRRKRDVERERIDEAARSGREHERIGHRRLRAPRRAASNRRRRAAPPAATPLAAPSRSSGCAARACAAAASAFISAIARRRSAAAAAGVTRDGIEPHARFERRARVVPAPAQLEPQRVERERSQRSSGAARRDARPAPSRGARKIDDLPDDRGHADQRGEIAERPRQRMSDRKRDVLPTRIRAVGVGTFDPRGVRLHE